MAEVDAEIRDHLAAYLGGEMTLDAFEEWFVARAWDERTALGARVDHLFAERDLLGTEGFHKELRAITSGVWVFQGPGPGRSIVVASGVTTLHRKLVFGGTETITRRLALAGRQHAAEPE